MQCKIQRCSFCTPQYSASVPTTSTQVLHSDYSVGGQPAYCLPTTGHSFEPTAHHHHHQQTDLNALVDSYAQFDDGSLMDYVFAQLEDTQLGDTSSNSIQGSGIGQGCGAPHIGQAAESAVAETNSKPNGSLWGLLLSAAAWYNPTGYLANTRPLLDASSTNTEAAPYKALERSPGIMSHNYARSLNYGIWFEDPQLECSFQDQITCQRRFGVWASWPALAGAILVGEASIKNFYPEDQNQLVAEPHQLLCAALVLGLISVFYCKVVWRKDVDSAYSFKVRCIGELSVYLASLRHLWFILNKCHWTEAGAQDWVFVTLILCQFMIVLPWMEISPISLVLCGCPLWSALILVPNVCMVFRLRVCAIALCMGVSSFVMYQNNREMFVTQVCMWACTICCLHALLMHAVVSSLCFTGEVTACAPSYS